MRHTAETVAALAASVDAAPSKLLTRSNPKTAKGEGYGYLTAILHLAPYKASGANLCPNATAGCIAACLNTAGRGGFDSTIQRARIRKSKWFRADRAAFMVQLEQEIRNHCKLAAIYGLLPAIRLNGTSDVPWESVRYGSDRLSVIERFPTVQFYDYTKVPTRFKRPLPPNYDLTFSMADGNERAAEYALNHGARVAVVFRNVDHPFARAANWVLPDSWRGVAVIDADKHDLRFLEPAGVYCGLKAKGAATRDASGFAHDVTPGKVV